MSRRWSVPGPAGLVVLVGIVALVLARSGGSSPEQDPAGQSVRTAAAVRTAVVWAVGDSADASQRGARLARRIGRDGPDLFVYLGDVYETGSAEEFRTQYEPLYGALARRTLPVIGNHESARRSEGYDPYWRGKLGHAIADWSVRTLAGWRIIAINTELPTDDDSEQWRWLRDQLQAQSGNCSILVSHRPRFSAGPHGDGRHLDDLWALLPGRVRIALSGHDHNSQRLDDWHGVTPLIAGGGAGPLPLDRTDERLSFGNGHTIAGLRLELSAGRASYRFIGEKGRVLHAGSARCRRR
jgi:3',5'-cyclic AMP phosphodiesterase CpdA